MEIKVIKTEKEYQQALKRLDEIFDAKVDSNNADELELLSLIIEKYEEEQFPMDLPDPIEAILFRMEQLGFHQKELASAIGLKSRASEILNRKRKLSLEMIRKLHQNWGIPTDVLIKKY
jgi:HTH-type transcriptional regulator / antitoxin HigA